MNKYLKVFLLLAIVSVAFFAADAFAATAGGGKDVFTIVVSRLTNTFKNVRTVVFVLGGFGLIGMGFGAIFGKIKWGWVAALASGLAVVALAGAAVDYVTQNSANTKKAEMMGFGDTLTGAN